jgi:predicted transposase YbfD/YdcC
MPTHKAASDYLPPIGGDCSRRKPSSPPEPVAPTSVHRVAAATHSSLTTQKTRSQLNICHTPVHNQVFCVAHAIRERGAHYVLCVKDNHPKLLDSFMFADIGPRGPLTPSSTHETTSTGHGRIEVRSCTAFDATDRLHKAEICKDVASFAVVERVRTVGGRTNTERAYCISSLPVDAERIVVAIRSHSEVENRLHWSLDVQFGDDYARGRIGHIAHKLALVRHMALDLIRLDKSSKTSIKTKRLLPRRRMSFAPRCSVSSRQTRMMRADDERVAGGALPPTHACAQPGGEPQLRSHRDDHFTARPATNRRRRFFLHSARNRRDSGLLLQQDINFILMFFNALATFNKKWHSTCFQTNEASTLSK